MNEAMSINICFKLCGPYSDVKTSQIVDVEYKNALFILRLNKFSECKVLNAQICQ